MKRIYLIGFMGCGKSTVSDYISRKYGWKQIEMDAQIVSEQKKEIAQIFAEEGETYFRNLETELLKRIASGEEECVVSCGGGTAMRSCNVEIMKRSGRIVWLKAKPETVYQRVKDTHDRPLLEGHMNVEYIEQLLEKRIPVYESSADLSVDTDGKSPEEIAQAVLCMR